MVLTTQEGRSRKISIISLRKKVKRLLKGQIPFSSDDITAKIFPSVARDTKQFAARSRMVKSLIPPYLRHVSWKRRGLWVKGGSLHPSLLTRLSISEKNGLKIIGGRSQPCRCVVSSKGTMKVRVYKRVWKGWLIQQLIDHGWPAEAAQKEIISLRCRLEASELNFKLAQALKIFKEIGTLDPATEIGLKLRHGKVALSLSSRLAEFLQVESDKEDALLRKLGVPESSQTVLASVSALHIDRLLQGLGLTSQQVRRVSDTLVTLGVEDQTPDFVYLIYGPRPTKTRQVGIRALITPLANYEILPIRR